MELPPNQPLHQFLHEPRRGHPGAVDRLLVVDDVRRGLEADAAAVIAHDLYHLFQHQQKKAAAPPEAEPLVPPELRWRFAVTLAAMAFLPMLLSSAIVVVPAPEMPTPSCSRKRQSSTT